MRCPNFSAYDTSPVRNNNLIKGGGFVIALKPELFDVLLLVVLANNNCLMADCSDQLRNLLVGELAIFSLSGVCELRPLIM